MSMTKLVNDATWIKTNGFIKKKYGKNISYRSIKLVSENINSKSSEDFYSVGEDLIIPLQLKNLNLGDIIVSRGSLLDQKQQVEVTDLIKFLVTPKIYSLQLKQTEENLRNLKIRPIFEGNSNRLMTLHETKKISKQTLSQVILLKSSAKPSEQLNRQINRNKVALKIHEMTERNLFVYFDDISSSIVTTDDFKMLNDITIYIDDMALVNEKSMNLIQEYIEKNNSEGPLFLIGSNLNLDEIKLTSLKETFKNKLSSFYFDIDRVPLAQQLSEDVLDLLFI